MLPFEVRPGTMRPFGGERAKLRAQPTAMCLSASEGLCLHSLAFSAFSWHFLMDRPPARGLQERELVRLRPLQSTVSTWRIHKLIHHRTFFPQTLLYSNPSLTIRLSYQKLSLTPSQPSFPSPDINQPINQPVSQSVSFSPQSLRSRCSITPHPPSNHLPSQPFNHPLFVSISTCLCVRLPG